MISIIKILKERLRNYDLSFYGRSPGRSDIFAGRLLPRRLPSDPQRRVPYVPP